MDGFGNLFPGYPNASIIVSFIKPDGSVIDLQIVTSNKGAFNFTYTPDVAGNWAVAAQWHSDKGYYTSAVSEQVPMEVSSEPIEGGNLPKEYAVAAGIVIIIVIVSIAVFFYMKQPKTIKP